MINIIIADDHAIVREGIKSVISSNPDYHIIYEAENTKSLLQQLTTTKCDIVILDIAMPDQDGLSVIKPIKTQYPLIKLIILSMFKDYAHVHKSISLGADAYIVKDDASNDLLIGIKTVLLGKKFISPAASTILIEHDTMADNSSELPALYLLTKREQEILALISQGNTNKQIASDLVLSIRTVEKHRLNISEKLGLKSTAQLTKFAIAKGI